MCLPAITDVLAAQQHDAVTQSYRAQRLDLGTAGGKAKLRAQGIDEKRICELSQYTLDENQVVLRYSPALAHYYNSEGLPCDADGVPIAPTTVTEDRERAMIVAPEVLQHAVMYLHHYPRLLIARTLCEFRRTSRNRRYAPAGRLLRGVWPSAMYNDHAL
jgi:hypothetical protein